MRSVWEFNSNLGQCQVTKSLITERISESIFLFTKKMFPTENKMKINIEYAAHSIFHSAPTS